MFCFKNFVGSVAILTMASFALPVNAQTAVPLTNELFDLSWVVVEYEGKGDSHGGGPATFFVADRKDGDVTGDTDCGTEWTAKMKIKLPLVSFSNVDAFISDECPAFRNTIAIMTALEKVRSAKTSGEGLEFLGADGKRLMLLVAGG